MSDLYSRSFGEPDRPSLLVLHGLMGSSRNWMAAARDMAEFAYVSLVDLRNHGQSFHADEHGYRLMAEDVLRWMDREGQERVHLMGHSMGGKLAMVLACHYPERLHDLIVVENAPRHHTAYYQKEIEALLRLDLSPQATRAELEKELEKEIPEWALRKFLLSGLIRDEESGEWRWQANLPVLYDALGELAGNPIREGDRYTGKSLFLMGEVSRFIPREERDSIPVHFPNARIDEIPLAAHNPHFEQREEFVKRVRDFVERD